MAPVAAELPRTSSEPRVPCTRSISSATSPSRPVSNTAKKKKKKRSNGIHVIRLQKEETYVL